MPIYEYAEGLLLILEAGTVYLCMKTQTVGKGNQQVPIT